jgi:thiamine pyrophosphate-dependent acetolactate synthase large subunit-like protein
VGCLSQAAGIRFVGFRNEQAAGYAAAAAGFLTGVPGVLLTVSGPGAVHGIAGLSHAQVNTWPMLMISGSAEQVGTFFLVLGLPPFHQTECSCMTGM